MSADEIQSLLRFLTSDARVPLAKAISAIAPLRQSGLDTVEALANVKTADLATAFDDGEISKSVVNAAKRKVKKRAAGDGSATTTSASKRRRRDPFEVTDSVPVVQIEQSLLLSSSQHRIHELEKMVLITNRAPLVLAFAVACVKHTMPEQPPSSRLSLAQAVVSLGAQSKAKAIGLSTGPSAGDEGWALGQPVVKVMNREISVLKRWGYEWRPREDPEIKPEDDAEVKSEVVAGVPGEALIENPALWAIDLDKLKALNGPLTFATTSSADTTGLPVYSPQAARAYLLRSFDGAAVKSATAVQGAKTLAKKSGSAASVEREQNVCALLQALDLLCLSWRDHISKQELDKRCWSWYVAVRPDVEHGVAGWGAKGELKLRDILDLRRKES